MNPRWRFFLALDLGLFNLALFVFAWLPPETLVPVERVAMALSLIAFIGVVGHAIPWVTLPGEKWAYLITGAVGLYVLLGYIASSTAPYYIKVPYCAFMLSGIASGYAAHVIDGATWRTRGRNRP